MRAAIVALLALAVGLAHGKGDAYTAILRGSNLPLGSTLKPATGLAFLTLTDNDATFFWELSQSLTPIAGPTSLDIHYAKESNLPVLLTLTTDFLTDAVAPNGNFTLAALNAALAAVGGTPLTNTNFAVESAQIIASVTAASGIAVGVFDTNTTFGSDEPEATTETYFIATPDGSFASNVTHGPTGIANSSNLIDITAAADDTYEFSVYLDGIAKPSAVKLLVKNGSFNYVPVFTLPISSWALALDSSGYSSSSVTPAPSFTKTALALGLINSGYLTTTTLYVGVFAEAGQSTYAAFDPEWTFDPTPPASPPPPPRPSPKKPPPPKAVPSPVIKPSPSPVAKPSPVPSPVKKLPPPVKKSPPPLLKKKSPPPPQKKKPSPPPPKKVSPKPAGRKLLDN